MSGNPWTKLDSAPIINILTVEPCKCLKYKYPHVHKPIQDKDGDIFAWDDQPVALPPGMTSFKFNLLKPFKGIYK
jgi:hypothetical protein